MRPTFFLKLLVLISGCKVNHLTGKKTFNAFSNKQLFPMALQQYNSFLKENKPVMGIKAQRQISKIGVDIVLVAQKYFAFKVQPNFLKEYVWEYNLVENEQHNACCMPGGKIVFYTGILPIAQNPDGIAVIMGHEMAHALADQG
jgi:Zn-dependent protease with chaperone function